MAQSKLSSSQLSGIPVVRQDITTNTTLTNPKTYAGWGYVHNTVAGTTVLTATVTFPTAFTSVPIVTVAQIGFVIGSNPTTPTGNASYIGDMVATCRNITTTTFEVKQRLTSGAGLAAGERWMFSWIAIGV